MNDDEYILGEDVTHLATPKRDHTWTSGGVIAFDYERVKRDNIQMLVADRLIVTFPWTTIQ